MPGLPSRPPGQRPCTHLSTTPRTLGIMTAELSLSLAERTVLAILSERPAHGFAIARLTAPGGDLGRIWQIPRPVIYRSITRLLDAGLLTQDAVESGRGPQRTLYAVTPERRRLARLRRYQQTKPNQAIPAVLTTPQTGKAAEHEA